MFNVILLKDQGDNNTEVIITAQLCGVAKYLLSFYESVNSTRNILEFSISH